MSTSPMRGAFLSKLQDKFYQRLRQEPLLAEWGASAIYALSIRLIEDKKAEINKYLDEKKFPLEKADVAIDEIITKFLMSEIGKITL